MNQAAPILCVVFLCDDYPPNLQGGIGRYTHILATIMAKIGHQVHVIARGVGQDSVEFENGVFVHRIVVKAQRRTIKSILMGVPKSKWNQPKTYLNEINKISKNSKVDIVHASVSNIIGIAVLLSGRYKLVTSLVTTLKINSSINPSLLNNKKKFKKRLAPVMRLEKKIIEKSDGVVASTQSIIKEIESSYTNFKVQKIPIAICPYGMPDYSKNYVSPPNKERLKILFVGRLEKRKGIDILLEAAAVLINEYNHVDFHIVGSSSDKPNIENNYRLEFEKEHPALSDRVIFHGKLSDEDLYEHYASCNIFVAPSRFESFGLIYLEAMIFSKAVIGCNVGGVSEVVEHEVSGLLADPDNVDALLHCLSLLIENEDLRKKYGEEGRKRYERYFTDMSMARSIEGLYEKVLSDAN